MVDSYRDDLSKYRTPGGEYNIESIQGRRTDGVDLVLTSVMSVGTTAAGIDSVGRRTFIKIKNLDSSNNIAVLTSSGTTYSGGYPVAAGAEWEDETDASLWLAAEAGTVDVAVYQRSKR
jgi:hypothetical protein